MFTYIDSETQSQAAPRCPASLSASHGMQGHWQGGFPAQRARATRYQSRMKMLRHGEIPDDPIIIIASDVPLPGDGVYRLGGEDQGSAAQQE